MNILKLIRRNKVKKLLTTERISEYKNLNDIDSCIFVYCETNDKLEEHLKIIFDWLKRNSIKYQGIIVYDQTKDPSLANRANPNLLNITKADLDIYSLPTNEDYKPIFEKKYDILLDLSNSLSHAVEYIVTASQASFKIGFNKHYSRLYELFIHNHNEDNNNIDSYLESTQNYLNLIKAKPNTK